MYRECSVREKLFKMNLLWLIHPQFNVYIWVLLIQIQSIIKTKSKVDQIYSVKSNIKTNLDKFYIKC